MVSLKWPRLEGLITEYLLITSLLVSMLQSLSKAFSLNIFGSCTYLTIVLSWFVFLRIFFVGNNLLFKTFSISMPISLCYVVKKLPGIPWMVLPPLGSTLFSTFTVLSWYLIPGLTINRFSQTTNPWYHY